MSLEPQPANHRSWTYTDISSFPLPQSIEDHLLVALRRLTASLDIAEVCAAVLDGVERVNSALGVEALEPQSRTLTLRDHPRVRSRCSLSGLGGRRRCHEYVLHGSSARVVQHEVFVLKVHGLRYGIVAGMSRRLRKM